ncbi:MAG: hypothetical protein LBH39_00745 [Clostridiales Family XIII bacterium]|jgi:hypothetical protein|nr:hypothetical protein [Clostridiales Family XIII bacterium]
MSIKWLEKARENRIDKLEEDAYETKDKYMESVLGKEYGMVMHAIIPYAIGGGLDLYYYPNYCAGAVIATKELTNYKFNEPKNDQYDAYELIMITKHKIDLDSVKEGEPCENTFAYDHKSINGILNCIAPYSTQSKLNQYDTIEFPEDFEGVGGKCLIIDAFSHPLCDKSTRNKKFGLMLLMEIHRNEMEYAMQQKGRDLIEKFKATGIYPFTGINRPSVV